MQEKLHPRDHIPLTRTARIGPGDPEWAAWEARIDAAAAASAGAPSPAAIATALRLADQERILFGRVRTRGLPGFGD